MLISPTLQLVALPLTLLVVNAYAAAMIGRLRSLPWTFVGRAIDPSRIVPGVYVVAGRGTSLAVAEVVDVSDDGVVHLRPLPGPLSAHEHLLARSA